MIALYPGQTVLIGLHVHLCDLGLELVLHDLDMLAQRIDGGGAVISRKRFLIERRAAHLLHKDGLQLVELSMDGLDPLLAPGDDGGHDGAAYKQGQQRYDNNRPVEHGELFIIPRRVKVHGDHSGHLAI